LRLERGGKQRIRERLRRSSLNSGDWRVERGGEQRLERKEERTVVRIIGKNV